MWLGAVGLCNLLTVCREVKNPFRIGRPIDAEEENYFNADDDDSDQPPPFISSPNLGGPSLSPLNGLRRKRRGALVPSKFRPQSLVLPRTPALPSLMDYGEEDEDAESPLSAASPGSLQESDTAPCPSSPGTDVPPSPRLIHRQISRPSNIPRRRSVEEDDNLLISLTRPKIQAPSLPHSETVTLSPKVSLPPIRLGEKRRREEEEDELLERLANRSKRADLGAHKDDEATSGRQKVASKPGDDPPKRMKVMFRPLSIAGSQQPSSPVPSETSAKDGDTG